MITMGNGLCEPFIGSISGCPYNNFRCWPLDIYVEWNGIKQCLL
jgi:hypothetical protein